MFDDFTGDSEYLLGFIIATKDRGCTWDVLVRDSESPNGLTKIQCEPWISETIVSCFRWLAAEQGRNNDLSLARMP